MKEILKQTTSAIGKMTAADLGNEEIVFAVINDRDRGLSCGILGEGTDIIAVPATLMMEKPETYRLLKEAVSPVENYNPIRDKNKGK